jgi:hypothetical protein
MGTVSLPETDVAIEDESVSFPATDVSVEEPNNVSIIDFYDPATLSLFIYLAEQGATPSATDLANYNNFSVALKSAGVWSHLDVCYLFAAATQTAALVNIIKPGTYNATAEESPTFTAYEGFTGNGTSSYLNSNYNPDSNGTNYTLDSSMLAARPLTLGNAEPDGAVLIGADNTSGTSSRSVLKMNTDTAVDLNSETLPNYSTADIPEWLAVSRTNSTTVEDYAAGSAVSSLTADVTVMLNNKLLILAENNTGGVDNWSTCQIASAYIGGSLTAAEITALYNADTAYMTAVGAI